MAFLYLPRVADDDVTDVTEGVVAKDCCCWLIED